MIDLKTKEAKEITAYFLNEINDLLFDPEEIAEELYNSELMKILDVYWIRMLSSKSYRTDWRNEASAEAGRQLAEIPFIKKQMETASDKKMEDIADRISTSHRTLQQSFSKLVFYHFMMTCNERDSHTLVEIIGDSFYKLPLI